VAAIQQPHLHCLVRRNVARQLNTNQVPHGPAGSKSIFKHPLAERFRDNQCLVDDAELSSYLVGLFDFTQPNATQGRSVSAREILDQGTERLNTDWNGDPAVKARLLSTLGTVYYRLGALDRGVSLLSEAVSLYAGADGPDSV
jgi:hypothetical protein